MTKPNHQAYFFGNKLTRILLFFFGAFITYGCIVQPADIGFGALFIVWVANWAGYESAKQIAAYNAFQAEWKGADAAVAPKITMRTGHWRVLWWAAGLGLWGFYGLGAIALAQDGTTGHFMFFSISSVAFIAWRLLRWSWNREPSPRGADTVSIAATPTPASSGPIFNPSILPDHVQSLFTQSPQNEARK